MQILNQYSAIWISAILVGITGVFMLRQKSKWLRVLVFGLLVVGLLAAWIIFHPRHTAPLSPAQVQASIGQGMPVLLEFQSPY
jgi:CHASE2 domain-containing sensor protein